MTDETQLAQQIQEVVFALKPEANGILKHIKSGVIYTPSWHGLNPLEVSFRMAQDMRLLLESKEWEFVEQEKPVLHTVHHKLGDDEQNASGNDLKSAKVTHIERITASTGTVGYKLFRTDDQGKKTAIAQTYSPKVIEQIATLLSWITEMEDGDTRAVKSPVMAYYKKSDRKSEHGNNYNDIVSMKAQ